MNNDKMNTSIKIDSYNLSNIDRIYHLWLMIRNSNENKTIINMIAKYIKLIMIQK